MEDWLASLKASSNNQVSESEFSINHNLHSTHVLSRGKKKHSLSL